jgi:hypothetical protein
MKFLNQLYQHINILSLDVVAGAVIGALFFARLFGVVIEMDVLVVLGLTVWIIYTIDHLRDARMMRTVASTDRHRFHQEHFKAIASITALVAMAVLVLIFFLPVEILKAGMVLGSIVVLYLVLQRYLKFLKEFFVACLYTMGILLPSLAIVGLHLLPVHYLIIAKYFITALMNLLLFSLYDYAEDRHQQQHSFVTWFGPTSTRYGIILLGALNIISGLWLWHYDPVVAFIFISMNLLLIGLLFWRNALARGNYYRMIGDGVFFLPLIYLL